MPSPGAATSTDFEPKFEKLASVSVEVVAATVRTFDHVNAAGYSGVLSMCSESLPAATTSSAPLSLASPTASDSADDLLEEPNEQLMTFAFSLIAYSIPATASDVEPRPLELM